MTRRGTELPRKRPAQPARPTPIDPAPFAGHPADLRHRVGGVPTSTPRQNPHRLSRPVLIGWTIVTFATLAWVLYLLAMY